MPHAKLTSKGQVTIAKAVREALGVQAGDRLDFAIRDDGVAEIRPRTIDLIDRYGMLKPKVQGITIDDMDQAIRSEAGRYVTP